MLRPPEETASILAGEAEVDPAGGFLLAAALEVSPGELLHGVSAGGDGTPTWRGSIDARLTL